MPEENLLISSEKYLKSGVHIGTRFKSGDMKRYVFKKRRDGLKVLDIETVDLKVRLAAKFLSKFSPERILVVSRKLYGRTPSKQFAESVGAKTSLGRFVPGTLTNSESKHFVEASAVIITEPESDKQAIKEAGITGIPVIGLCSTNNSTRQIDLVIPVNNKGRKSLALVYWLLAREILLEKGLISSREGFGKNLEAFEHQITEEEREEQEKEERREMKEKRFSRRPRFERREQ